MKMKNMLTILMFALVALFTTQASALPILFDNGTFKFTGDNYLDASDPTNISGIGRVTTITEGSTIIWSSGASGQYLNFVFAGFNPGPNSGAPFYNFAATGGTVDFYLTSNASAFNAGLSLLSGTNQIISTATSLFMSTSAVGTTYGTAGNPNGNYSSTGFLDVTGGDMFAQLHTQSLWTGVGSTFADLAFGLVGSANHSPLINADYAYVSSANLTGLSQIPVPEPTMLMLMGLGILAFAFATRKDKVASQFVAMSA